MPLSADEFVVRQQLVYSRRSGADALMTAEVDVFEARTVAGFGVTPKLALFGVLPIVDVDRRTGSTRMQASGLGDAALFARYEVFRADRPGRTFRVAPYAGVRLPTGESGRTGDGSVDFFGGLIATVASTKWNLDTQLRYDLNREADGFERGNSVTFESSYQRRLAPGVVNRDTNAFLFGVLELSASYQGRDRLAGARNADSGGFQVHLTPGLQYAARRWIADLGVQLPVVNNLNGSALESDYAVATSIRFNF